MQTEEFKDVLLQVLELQLEYQLRAIRQLRRQSLVQAEGSVSELCPRDAVPPPSRPPPSRALKRSWMLK